MNVLVFKYTRSSGNKKRGDIFIPPFAANDLGALARMDMMIENALAVGQLVSRLIPIEEYMKLFQKPVEVKKEVPVETPKEVVNVPVKEKKVIDETPKKKGRPKTDKSDS